MEENKEGSEPKTTGQPLVYAGEPNTINFRVAPSQEPILVLKENGEILVKGKLIEQDKELVDGMREFLKSGKVITSKSEKDDLNTILEGAVYFQLAQLYDGDEMSIPYAKREHVKNSIVKEFWERYNAHISNK